MIKSKENVALIIFVRNPELGKVKTRLAKGVGDEQALTIYKQLLDHTKTISSQIDARRYVFYADGVNEKDMWSAELFEKRNQADGDLGARMNNAFETVFKEGVEQAIIIGSDCIELNEIIIEQAIKQLEENDIVLGPTFDGGYYLLGMKQLHSTLFENMKYSVDSVFKETVKRIQAGDLTYKSLDKLNDIDHKEDWERHLKQTNKLNTKSSPD